MMSETEKKPEHLPEYIGRYRLKEEIGKGGMARIYRATDEIIGRDVAIKISNSADPTWKDLDTSAIMKQFTLETQISGQLSHHTFVTIYDAGLQGDICYLVMELMEGHTLQEIIKGAKPNMDLKEKLDIIVQISRSLHYAHQRGIVHRDIKPSNIMVLKNGQAKLMDFGVAFVSDGAKIHLSSPQEDPGVSGTPYYMSPEQLSKTPDLDGRSDLFSMAVVTYEFLTKKRPFTSDNLKGLYEKILKSEPTAMVEINKSIPEKIVNIISLCMSKDRNLRLQSCNSYADQLDEVINESFFKDKGSIIAKETLEILEKYRESFSFFFDLDNQEIYQLLKVCQVKKFSKEEEIFKEGAVARDMYLVMSGRIKIVKGPSRAKSYLINVLKRGDIFGEMGIIDGAPRSASAIAESDTQVLAIHQVSLLRCKESTAAKLYRNLAQILSAKLRATSGKLDDIIKETNY